MPAQQDARHGHALRPRRLPRLPPALRPLAAGALARAGAPPQQEGPAAPTGEQAKAQRCASPAQVPDGFEWPFDEQRSCVTVFSASNYAGRTKNQGAYLLLGAPGSSVSDEEARAGAAEGERAKAQVQRAMAALEALHHARLGERDGTPPLQRSRSEGNSSLSEEAV